MVELRGRFGVRACLLAPSESGGDVGWTSVGWTRLMSSIATSSRVGQPGAGAPGKPAAPIPSGVIASLVDRFGRANLLMLGALAIAFFAVFFRWVYQQLGPEGWSWQFTEDWGHAYVVPLISGYYVWRSRDWFARQPMRIFWPGLCAMLLGIVCYVYFIVGFPNHMFQGFAMILSLAGLVMFVFGADIFRGLLFPLGYLGLGVTISEMIMIKVTWGLKLLASHGSEFFLALVGPLFGADVVRTGNILNVYHGQQVHPLNVADACAGMRMVVAFIALAVAVAFLSCQQWWQRVMIVLLSIPVALFMNVLRVGILGLLTIRDPELAVGGAHAFVGTLLLVPAFALFMGCVWAVKKITPDPGESGTGAMA